MFFFFFFKFFLLRQTIFLTQITPGFFWGIAIIIFYWNGQTSPLVGFLTQKFPRSKKQVLKCKKCLFFPKVSIKGKKRAVLSIYGKTAVLRQDEVNVQYDKDFQRKQQPEERNE